MTSVAWPLAYSTLFTAVDAALSSTDARPSDGYDLSDDPGDLVQLGVPNITDTEAIGTGSYEQEQIGHGAAGVIKETGSISGNVLAYTGDKDPTIARSKAFGYLDAIAAAIRADRHLGFTDFDITFGITTSGDIAEDKVNGVTTAISFTVNYTALLGA